MEWVKLASSYYLSRKVASLPDADAEVMFLRGMAYCGQAETSGFIPGDVLLGLGRRKHRQSANALVAAGLWVAADGGWLVVDWHEWQKELELLIARKKRDRDRKRAERVRGLSTDNPQTGVVQRVREREHPPNPPQAGGTACQVHKSRPKAWCVPCQRPAPTRPDSTPVAALCDHGRHGPSCPFCLGAVTA